jgi:hypothetical protein
MRKMKLDIETVAVESFATEAGELDARGTVCGNAVTQPICTAETRCGCPLSWDGSCRTGLNCQQVC